MDIFLVALILLAAWQGYKEGFIRALTSIVSSVVSLYFAAIFYGLGADWLVGITGWKGSVCRIVVFIVLVVLLNRLVVVLMNLADRALRTLMGLPIIRTINRALGAACRGLETIIFIAIFIYLIHRFPFFPVVNSWFDSSYIAEYSTRFITYLWPFLLEVIHSF